MKKIAAIVIFYCLVISSYAQENPKAVWTNQRVDVNGNASEWKPPLKFFDNETNLFFAIKNDSNNLYLCFQSKNEMIQTKIMESGMRIILSDKINGKHKSVLSFPISAKHSLKSPANPDEIKPDPLAPSQTRRALFLAGDTTMEVKGFEKTNGTISVNNTSGIRAAIDFDSANTLTYEVAIPFRELFGDHYDLKDITKDISLNVIINSTPGNSRYSGDGYSGRGEGRMDGGYGGQHGGSRSEGEEAGQYQQRAAISQKLELKERFVLVLPRQ